MAELDRRGRAAPSTGRGTGHVLRRLRSDRTEPAHRQPRPADRGPARCSGAGHTPLLLVGGSTGHDRRPEGLRRAGAEQQGDGGRLGGTDPAPGRAFLDFDGPERGAGWSTTCDWTATLSVLDFLRDIGKHFPVNRMLARDVVRKRGWRTASPTPSSPTCCCSRWTTSSCTATYGCTLQFGGSDQWGNITAGVELIRRADGARVHALATPLLTKADGTKFGKTEGGAVWLDPAMTSPYAFHQFLLQRRGREGRRVPQGLQRAVPGGDRRSWSGRPRSSRTCARPSGRWPTT